MLLSFVQLEFTHAVGVPGGQYLLRPPGEPMSQAPGPNECDVLLVEFVEGRAAKRRPRGTSAEVALAVVTLILATEPHADRAQAQALLDARRNDATQQHALLTSAVRALNRAVRAYRAAAADPYVIEISEYDPRSALIGYGQAGQIGADAWLEAAPLSSAPTVRASREDQMRVWETVGSVLAGRDAIFEAEELALRALLDLEHGRLRGAAAQARGAVEVLRDELAVWGAGADAAGVKAVDAMDADMVKATATHVLETAAAYRAAAARPS